jgi:hypothetical protein
MHPVEVYLCMCQNLVVNVSKKEDDTKHRTMHNKATKTCTFSYPSTAMVNLTYEVYCSECMYKDTIQPY